MASLVNQILISLIAFTFVLGQTWRPTLFGIQTTSIDILLPILAATNFLFHLRHRTKVHNPSFVIFLLIALLTLTINLVYHQYSPIKPFFYFLRLTSLISFFIFPLTLSKFSQFFFFTCLIANLIFGLFQYCFWPDFTYFNALGWDPHLYRLVSTFFDPTFTALIYLLAFIYIFFQPNSKIKYLLLVLFYIGMALTYSRSTYLAFLGASFLYSLIQKQPKYFLVSLCLIGLTVLFLPRKAGEGSKLERTSSIFAKVQNYKQAFSTIVESPLIGYGYNNLPQLKNASQIDHSAGGFDNSFLTIFATTGIFGFIFFLKGFYNLTKYNSIVINISLLSIIIHSSFANSLLFPWIIFYLAVVFSIYHKSR